MNELDVLNLKIRQQERLIEALERELEQIKSEYIVSQQHIKY